MSARAETVIDDTRLILEHHFRAGPDEVWRAWTEPAALARWFGPENIERVEVENDLVVGGHYRVVMHAANGEQHNVGGTYREIMAPRKLVFTWAWASTPERESLVSVELERAGDGTRLILTHERFADRDASNSHAAGWAGSLLKLAALFA